MKTQITYTKAYKELERLVNEIEDDKIQLDVLAAKVTEAKIYITFCEKQLRTIDGEVKDAME